MLRWAKDNRLHRNEDLCYFAATALQIPMLEWLLVNGCPWDDRVIERLENPLVTRDVWVAPEGTYPTISQILRLSAGSGFKPSAD